NAGSSTVRSRAPSISRHSSIAGSIAHGEVRILRRKTPIQTMSAVETAWWTELRAEGAGRRDAEARLHDLLLKAARFEVARRRQALPQLSGKELDDLAVEAAGDAALAVLRRLDDFRGESRFTTWAYKFALLEAAAKVRKRSWQRREIPLSPEAWPLLADDHQRTAQQSIETSDQLSALHDAIDEELTPHQREVLVA